jgi:GxxExxY protein
LTAGCLLKKKSIEKLTALPEAQLLTYMKFSSLGLDLLLNFNARLLKDGIRRLVLPT